MNEAYLHLNAQSMPMNITWEDISDYILIVDDNDDNVLNKTELLSNVEPVLFELALEFGLRSKDPYSVYVDNIDEQGISVELTKLFPTNNSTINVTELKEVFKKLDTNEDKKIEREEIYALFMKHHNFLAQPFIEKLRSSMLKLD